MQPAHYAQPSQPVQPNEQMEPRMAVQPAERQSSALFTYRASQIVYLILAIIEALMITRVALKLLAANPDVGFVRFVYGMSAPLVAPFQGIFPTPVSNSNVLELSSLVAIAVYGLIAWGIVRIIFILGRRPSTAG